MEEKQIKNLIKQIPTPEPREEFLNELGKALEKKGDEIFRAKAKKNTSFFSIHSWQLSLAFTSIFFFMLVGVIIFTSPETMNNIKEYAQQKVTAEYSDEKIVKVVDLREDEENEEKEVQIFVYYLLEEGKPPLDIDVNKDEDIYTFGLYPGKYRVVIIDGDEILEDKDITIKQEDGLFEIKLK